LKGQQGSSLPFFFVFSLYEEGYNMYRLQGSQSQKAEKGNALCEILTPTSKGIPDFLLGFDANQPNLFLEGRFPILKFFLC
jgi:hypothetical protein